jgi:hypothetical protein
MNNENDGTQRERVEFTVIALKPFAVAPNCGIKCESKDGFTLVPNKGMVKISVVLKDPMGHVCERMCKLRLDFLPPGTVSTIFTTAPTKMRSLVEEVCSEMEAELSPSDKDKLAVAFGKAYTYFDPNSWGDNILALSKLAPGDKLNLVGSDTFISPLHVLRPELITKPTKARASSEIKSSTGLVEVLSTEQKKQLSQQVE